MAKQNKQQKPNGYTTFTIDEFGYISGKGAFKEDSLTDIDANIVTNSTNQDRKQKAIQAAHTPPSASSPKLDEILESTPAGYLDPLQPPPVKVLLPISSMDTLASPRQSPDASVRRSARPVTKTGKGDEHSTTTEPQQVFCPNCGVMLHPQNLKRHIQKEHGASSLSAKRAKSLAKKFSARPAKPKSAKKSLTTCPVCGVAVGEQRLAKHLRKVHSTYTAQPTGKTTVKQQAPQRNIQSRRQPTSTPPQPAELDQAFYESRFGDKYVGLARREGSGRFGSLPLYDDYSDEADAD